MNITQSLLATMMLALLLAIGCSATSSTYRLVVYRDTVTQECRVSLNDGIRRMETNVPAQVCDRVGALDLTFSPPVMSTEPVPIVPDTLESGDSLHGTDPPEGTRDR